MYTWQYACLVSIIVPFAAAVVLIVRNVKR